MDFSALIASECPLCQEEANLIKTSDGPMCEKCYYFELNNNSHFLEKEFPEDDGEEQWIAGLSLQPWGK